MTDQYRMAERVYYSAHDEERRFLHEPKEEEERPPFEIDRSRIIHSTAFRRLQGKTQVFATGEGDFYRTRLTHSLEVSQIGKGLALRLGADPDLVEAICLAHDLGHPPFGHTGEGVLQRLMEPYGGFEGNGQTLRILTRLESKSEEFEGLNLTRATIDGVLKYKYKFPDGPQGAKKFFFEEELPSVEWACPEWENRVQSFECQIMDWADEIAYSVHDLEDGIKAEMLSSGRLQDGKVRDAVLEGLSGEETRFDGDWWEWVLEQVKQGEQGRIARRELTSHLIHYFIFHTYSKAVVAGQGARYARAIDVSEEVRGRRLMLNLTAMTVILQDQKLATLRYKAEQTVERLFEVLMRPRAEELYPEDFRDQFARYKGAEQGRARVACDYIAGMTDSYALRLYSRLFSPEPNPLHKFL